MGAMRIFSVEDKSISANKNGETGAQKLVGGGVCELAGSEAPGAELLIILTKAAELAGDHIVVGFGLDLGFGYLLETSESRGDYPGAVTFVSGSFLGSLILHFMRSQCHAESVITTTTAIVLAKKLPSS